MNTLKEHNREIARAAGVLVVIVATVMLFGWRTPMLYAASPSVSEPGSMEGMPITAMPTDVFKTSAMIGTKVRNTQGELLGTVHDIVLTSDAGTVSYVALSRGGILGLGSKYYAVPWSAVSITPDGKKLTLPISKKDLLASTGFSYRNWPDRGDARLSNKPGEMGVTTFVKPGDAAFTMRRVSQITKMDAGNRQGKFLGSLDDLCIDKMSGRVIYGIVSWTNSPDSHRKLAAVPWDLVVLQSDPPVAGIDVDKTLLESVAFENAHWPNLNDTSYAQSLYWALGEEPYPQVYGYGAAGERIRTGGNLKSGFPAPERSPETREVLPPGGDMGGY